MRAHTWTHTCTLWTFLRFLFWFSLEPSGHSLHIDGLLTDHNTTSSGFPFPLFFFFYLRAVPRLLPILFIIYVTDYCLNITACVGPDVHDAVPRITACSKPSSTVLLCPMVELHPCNTMQWKCFESTVDVYIETTRARLLCALSRESYTIARVLLPTCVEGLRHVSRLIWTKLVSTILELVFLSQAMHLFFPLPVWDVERGTWKGWRNK